MSTPTIPIVGTFEEFTQDILGTLERCRDEADIVKLFGEGPEFPFVVCNPEYIGQILVEKSDCFASNLENLKVMIGDGILTSDGETHRKARQVMQPQFLTRSINKYGPSVVRLTENHISDWVEGEVRNIAEDMMSITLDVITDTMFGYSIDDAKEDNLHSLLRPLAAMFVEKVRFEGHEPAEVSAERNAKLQEIFVKVDKLIYGLIEERRANPQDKREDLLSMLLRLGMPEKMVRDQVMTIFMAGHDSTTQQIGWTWYLLSQHPEIEQKFHEELDRVLKGAVPTVELVKEMTYLQNIVQESLRIYPATFSISRRAVKDVEIGGHVFKPGDQIFMPQYAVHRDAKWYDQPDKFIPERWECDLLKNIPTHAFFPFGAGPRSCLGNNFAVMEATLVLCVIGQKYRLSLAEGTVVVPEPQLNLHPKNLMMQPVKR